MLPALAAAALGLALVALPPPPLALPLNGDFAQGSFNWERIGLADVADGRGLVGQAGCFGSEPAAVIARLTTIVGVPSAGLWELHYDYRITTSDAVLGDGLRVVAIDPAFGDRINLDMVNPHTEQGVCGVHEGHRAVHVPYVSGDLRIEFHVWGDATGDRFLAEIDNVRVVLR